MTQLDWKKDYRHLYFPAQDVVEIKVPEMNFLMMDGTGNPNNSPQFQAAVEILYGLSYTIKYALKKSGREEYPVFPLEGLWWADDMAAFSNEIQERSSWKWRLIIAQPSFVTVDDVEMAQTSLSAKKKDIRFHDARFESYCEGDAVQLMHMGLYSEEGPNIIKLHRYIEEHGWKISGLHHEIYLSDPRRVAPEKQKTVIRQPFVA